jgi:hypothetical protein
VLQEQKQKPVQAPPTVSLPREQGEIRMSTPTIDIYNSQSDLFVVLQTTEKTALRHQIREVLVVGDSLHQRLTADCEDGIVALPPCDLYLLQHDGPPLVASIRWGSLTKMGQQVRIVASGIRLRWSHSMATAS